VLLNVDDHLVGVELLHCPVERVTGKRHREHLSRTLECRLERVQ
jgi:hypothetical protein